MEKNMERIWDLSALCAGFETPGFTAAVEELKTESKSAADKMKAILASPGTVASVLEKAVTEANGWEKLQNVNYFAALSLEADSNDERAMKAVNVCESCEAGFELAKTLLEHYVSKIGEESIAPVIDSSPLLKEHEFFLREILKKSAHKLSEGEEYAIEMLYPTGGSAWSSLQGALTSNLMVPIVIDGGEKKLPLSVVRNMYYDSDAAKRKTAYEAELAAYAQIERPAAFALNAIKGEAITVASLRGYKDPLDMTLLNYRMERGTLNALIGAIEDYLPRLTPFFNIKAKLLGHGDGAAGLPFYDIFAPVGGSDMRFTFDEAVDFVVKNFSGFSGNLGRFAKEAADKNRIDVYPREGKRGGAFCMSIHAIKESRFLLNFDGSFDSVTTLAHELGHGYHSHRLINESSVNAQYTSPIAETASTLAETVVCKAAYDAAGGGEKIAILENSISGALQVVVDIYSRYVFEGAIFEKRKNGSLSAPEIKAEMINAQKKAYGQGLDHRYLHPCMWINKCHYYNSRNNFYNFPYAYGQLFALGLYAQYEKEGAAFSDKYDAILSATGKNTLEGAAEIAGIDVTDKAFWLSSLGEIEKDLEKFKNLLDTYYHL